MPIKGRLTDMQNEVKLMRELGDCEYIVRFVAYYRVGEGANLQQHIVMEVRTLAPTRHLATHLFAICRRMPG